MFAASAIAISAYLLAHDPGLVERRMRAGPVAESRSIPKFIQAVTGLCFVGMLVVSGPDHRFGWSHVPPARVALANEIVAASFWTIYLVFRENSFGGSTIEVTEQQRLIVSGLYAYVCHSMYAGALPMLIAISVALGSRWGMLLVIPNVCRIDRAYSRRGARPGSRAARLQRLPS